MKRGDRVQNISKLTFKLSYCFKHFSFMSYLHVTFHLPQPLMDGKDSKVDKMSSTHPNFNPLEVLDSIIQSEHMRKILFLYFEFDQLQH
jgi:hypothetical protein